MQSTRYRPWLCASCGYAVDTVSAVRGDAIPRNGDMAICLNCGAPQILDKDAWRPMRSDDWHDLTAGERRLLTEAMLTQRLAKPAIGDLNKDDGRA